MKSFFFHLMPYGNLDLSYADKHNSAWATLPNAYFDAQIGRSYYERYIGELTLADELGFDGICVNEHHQTAYGLMPAPNLIAAALTRTTKRAKIAVLGRALPLVHSPVAIAEELAMLDQLSGGRLIAGFVRGVGAEYYANAINPTHSHARFHEAHDLIIQAWTRPGPFPFRGRHFEFEYVNLWPKPLQSPHPPVWLPSQGSSETVEWGAAPERRYTYLQTFSPLPVAKKAFDYYREVAERAGYTAQPSQLGWAVPIYVAETDEIARREARPHMEALFTKFLRMPIEMRLPPGYSSVASIKNMIEQRYKVRSAATTLEALMDFGIIVVGSPATVRQRIAEIQKDLGVGTLIAMLQIATLPADLTEKNMRLFAGEVMPFLRGLGVDAPTAAESAVA